MADPWIQIGRVRSVNPNRRELRIAARPAHAHEFGGLRWIHLAVRGGEAPLRCRVESVEAGPGGATVKLSPGVTRDSVGRMKGAAVMLKAEEQTVNPDAPWRVEELVGLQVYGPGSVPMGTVSEAYPTPAGGAFALEQPDGKTVLLPAIPEVIAAVDPDRGAMTVFDVAPYMVEDDED